MRQSRHFLVLPGILFFCFAFLFPARAQENLPEVIKKVQRSIVLITIYNEKGDLLGQGSGFFITKNGEVVTCRHVLEGAIKGEVQTTAGKKYAVKEIVAEDKEGDLIRFSIDIPKDTVEPLSLSISAPLSGERVAVIGSPLGLEATVSDGIVSAVRDVPGFGKVIQMTAPISPGSSGSPVINPTGEVVGIVSFYLTKGQNLNFAISSERIERLLTGKGKNLALWAASQESGESAEKLFREGVNLVLKEEYANAIPLFEKAIKIKPDFAFAYFELGLSHRMLGHYREALDVCKWVMTTQPQPDDVETKKFYAACYHYVLGDSYRLLGRHQEALDAYKQAIRLNPKSADSHYHLGLTYAQFRCYQEAIDSCKQAIRLSPDFVEAYYHLGLAYGMLEHYQEEIDAYKQVIRLKPDDAKAHNNLGRAYQGLKHYQEAIDAHKQAIRLSPEYAEAHSNLGSSYFFLGRYQEAIDAGKQAIRLSPENATAHCFLGLSYLQLKENSLALEEYKILKNLDSKMAEALFKLIMQTQEPIKAPKEESITTYKPGSKADWRMLQRWMSKSQVIELLGDPPSITTITGGSEFWKYGFGYVIFDERGRVTSWSEPF